MGIILGLGLIGIIGFLISRDRASARMLEITMPNEKLKKHKFKMGLIPGYSTYLWIKYQQELKEGD
jgi:hypothetical protein